LGENEEAWGVAGLIHDLDYNSNTSAEEHGLKTREILEEEGCYLSEDIFQAVAAHNWSDNKVEPKKPADWALFSGDSLTGLIVACALVSPDKKLSSLTTDSILKKFPQKRFAAGTRREDIKMCQEKLGISLEKFVEVGLKSMQEISEELGL
ncbi:MAG: phosphohydrolase, partial [Candidatus Shapirobacteria bacterium]|nr:phosphohydrolase [Candidatus Shapirobacteria bacterium]